MNSDSLNHHEDVWSELPDPLCHVAKSIHEADPPRSDMASFLSQLTASSPDNLAKRSQSEAEPAAALPQPHTVTRAARQLWQVGAGVTALAACLLAVLLVLPSSAARALEQIARALAGRPCVKMTTTESDGKIDEHWYLPGKNISAWRNEAWIEYRDHETQIVDSFDRVEQKLYRSPDSPGRQNDFVTTLVESLISLRSPSAPKQFDGFEILSSKLSSTDGDGSRQTLALELRNPQEAAAPPIRLTVVFNATTHLPEAVSATGIANGMELRTVTRFEYPEFGPADVFALGVPANAPLVNRIPSTDMRRLVAGVFAGRLRFDDYRAIVIKGATGENGYDPAGDILLIAKKGTKSVYFRLTGPLPGELAVQSRDDVAQLLLAHHDQFQWCPVSVIHGQTHFSFDTSFQPLKDSRQTITVSKVHSYTYENMTPEEFIPPAWYDYPHVAGRPPLGIGRQDIATSIATEATGGPEGCVLLQTQRSGRLPEAPRPPDDTTVLSNAGYWIRADRDFLVMQDTSSFDNGDTYEFVLDELARSPQGRWYPTRARNIHGVKSGQTRIDYISYHLEFGGHLSDEQFDPHHYVGQR